MEHFSGRGERGLRGSERNQGPEVLGDTPLHAVADGAWAGTWKHPEIWSFCIYSCSKTDCVTLEEKPIPELILHPRSHPILAGDMLKAMLSIARSVFFFPLKIECYVREDDYFPL